MGAEDVSENKVQIECMDIVHDSAFFRARNHIFTKQFYDLSDKLKAEHGNEPYCNLKEKQVSEIWNFHLFYIKLMFIISNAY